MEKMAQAEAEVLHPQELVLQVVMEEMVFQAEVAVHILFLERILYLLVMEDKD
jgi:hypothetical protein